MFHVTSRKWQCLTVYGTVCMCACSDGMCNLVISQLHMRSKQHPPWTVAQQKLSGDDESHFFCASFLTTLLMTSGRSVTYQYWSAVCHSGTVKSSSSKIMARWAPDSTAAIFLHHSQLSSVCLVAIIIIGQALVTVPQRQ